MTKSGVIRTNHTYKVSGNTDQRIRALAKTTGRTMSAVIEDAVLHAHLRRTGRLEASARYALAVLSIYCFWHAQPRLIERAEYERLLAITSDGANDDVYERERRRLIELVRVAKQPPTPTPTQEARS